MAVLKIWIDGDACPRAVKEVVFKASARLKVPVCLVANTMVSMPPGPLYSFVRVEKGVMELDLPDENATTFCSLIPTIKQVGDRTGHNQHGNH